MWYHISRVRGGFSSSPPFGEGRGVVTPALCVFRNCYRAAT
jgi:hypothetical protein